MGRGKGRYGGERGRWGEEGEGREEEGEGKGLPLKKTWLRACKRKLKTFLFTQCYNSADCFI